MDFEPMHPGFESVPGFGNRIIFFYVFFFFFCHLLQCKFRITVSTQILLVYYPL